MREERLKGYLYVPGTGAPVVAYAKNTSTVAAPAGVRGDDRRQKDRAAEVKSAAEGAQHGLYRATVVYRPGTEKPWTVERGHPLASLTDEMRRLDAKARSRREGRVIPEREVKRARAARALADALRAHVLRISIAQSAPRPARATRIAPTTRTVQ